MVHKTNCYHFLVLNKTTVLTGEVPLSDSKVERTERLAGDDPRTVLEVGKLLLQHVVQLGAEGEVVDENDGAVTESFPVVLGAEVSLVKFVLAVLLAVPGHPPWIIIIPC